MTQIRALEPQTRPWYQVFLPHIPQSNHPSVFFLVQNSKTGLTNTLYRGKNYHFTSLLPLTTLPVFRTLMLIGSDIILFFSVLSF